MIDNLIEAYRFIFDRHPRANHIMDRIMSDERITVAQFEKWYRESLEA